MGSSCLLVWNRLDIEMCKKCFGISKIYTDVEEERKQEGGGVFLSGKNTNGEHLAREL